MNITDDMCVAYSHCDRFEKRSDMNAFNMTDFRSCENCSHLNAEDKCILGKEKTCRY